MASTPYFLDVVINVCTRVVKTTVNTFCSLFLKTQKQFNADFVWIKLNMMTFSKETNFEIETKISKAKELGHTLDFI